MPEKPIRRKKKVEEGGEGVQRREEARTDGPVGRKEGELKEQAGQGSRPSGTQTGQSSRPAGGQPGQSSRPSGRPGAGSHQGQSGRPDTGGDRGTLSDLAQLGNLLGGGSGNSGNVGGNLGGLGNLLGSGSGNAGSTPGGNTNPNTTNLFGNAGGNGNGGGNNLNSSSGGSRKRGGCSRILLILVVLVVLLFLWRSCSGGSSSSNQSGTGSQNTGTTNTVNNGTTNTGNAGTTNTANTGTTNTANNGATNSADTGTTVTPSWNTGTTNNSGTGSGNTWNTGTTGTADTGTNSSYGGLSSLFGNTVSNNSWTTSSNAGQLDSSVVNGARPKRTEIYGNGQDVVTIMVYMCGTDLESRSAMASRDLQEMLNATINNPNLRLLVYTGGCRRWQNNIISSQTNQIYNIYNGQLSCLANNVGSKPMVDPATLTEFIQYCAQVSPSNRYELIFWDHGGGSESGYGYDEKYSTMGAMSLGGINKALYDAGVTFDFIGFDACLMATVETALVVGQYADYLIGSEETEPGVGWYYTDWLTSLSADTSMPTLDIGKQIVDSFTNACATTCYGQDTTLSVIDLAELAYTIPSNLTAFARSTTNLIENNQYRTVSNARSSAKEFAASTKIDQVDLVDLAQNMGTQEGRKLAEAVLGAVKYNKTSASVRDAFGLSVYFPYSRTSKVDSMVSTYESIGMDEEYARCIKEFASMSVAGQAASGGTSYGMDTLLGQLLGGNFGGSYGSSYGSSYGGYGGAYSDSSYSGSSDSMSADVISQLLSAYLSGGRSSVAGLTEENTKFLDVLDVDTAAAYIADTLFDPADLEWKENADGDRIIAMSDEQWAKLNSLRLNFFYDDGEGILDLGMDNLYDTDADDNLLEPQDRTWISINGQPVAYYSVSESGDEEDYTIIGRIPAEINGDDANLIVVFNSENEDGFVAGAVYDYEGEDIDVIAKSLITYESPETAFESDGQSIKWNEDLAEDYEIRFLCDSYDTKGTYEGTYYIGSPVTVSGWDELGISNTDAGDGDVYAAYVFTDIYGEQYWSPFLKL